MFLCKRTDDALDLPLPTRQSPQAAGIDLHANVHEEIILQPGSRAKIPAGVCLALPVGHEAQVRPRSGLAFRYGVTMLNGPGTVDADYRGEVGVLLINLGQEPFTIRRGDRIAQLVISRVEMANLTEAESLPESERAAGGYGSTGI